MNNETILNYINSKDIRNHLKTIGYQFTSLEAAWLIYQCQNINLTQKHEAWKEIITTMPDMPIESRAWKCPEKSLHDFLIRYMEIENRWIEDFNKTENVIYRYAVRYTDGKCFQYDDSNCVFSSFAVCQAAAKDCISEYNDEEIQYGWVKITRKEINDADEMSNYMEVKLNAKMEMISIEDYRNCSPDADGDTHIMFEEMWFSFPAPFKKGDIIYNITAPLDSFCCGPMVMDNIAPAFYSEKGRKGCDTSDMSVWGYFQNGDTGSIYGECSYNYMDYEYYPPEKLTGKRRIFLALSNFMKGKIDISLFVKAYHQIMLEESAIEQMPEEFTQDGLILAGIAKGNGGSGNADNV